jgi:hypothetical protein
MYWPAEEVERVGQAVRAAGARMPLAHISMEYAGGNSSAVLSLDLWPGNGSVARHDRLGTVADHGVPVRLAPAVTLGA